MLLGVLYLRVEEIDKWNCHKVENGKHDVALVANVVNHRRRNLDNQKCPEPLTDYRNGITSGTKFEW